jgi:hypothetical protein
VAVMIVRETEHEFVMITQNDHAHLSGVLASHFNKEFFREDSYYQELILAIYEHDRSWIRLDDTPLWNDRKQVPFSFMDYPLLPRLTLYTYGLDEIEKMSKYACLICSLHYSSFFQSNKQKECIDFYEMEISRQKRIEEELQLSDQVMIEKHLRLLQLCDDLSLYVCLNEPGADKDNEYPEYRNGFSNSEKFSVDNNILTASWKSQNEIVITSFPFDHEFSTKLRLKRMSKNHITLFGIEEAYKKTKWIDQEIIYCK